MSIDEAEEIFDKRWNVWNEKERIEFVRCLTAQDMKIPIVINLAMVHVAELQPGVVAELCEQIPAFRSYVEQLKASGAII